MNITFYFRIIFIQVRPFYKLFLEPPGHSTYLVVALEDPYVSLLGKYSLDLDFYPALNEVTTLMSSWIVQAQDSRINVFF